jgi:septal ring factor EnvC (AmiA/AmiB activator)
MSRCLDNNPPRRIDGLPRSFTQARQQQPTRTRMSSRRESDFERLEQLLREADERAKEANERAERERRRAEDEQRKTRPTSFEEYIRACHTLLSKPLSIQTDKSLSTQGSITSPKNKPCPTLLKPWAGYLRPTIGEREGFGGISAPSR